MDLPSHWYAVALSQEVRPGQILPLMRFGQALVFWRNQEGVLSVMEDRCPHRFARLSGGAIVDGTLQCPFHGLQFDSQGRCEFVPELECSAPQIGVKVYPTVEKGGWIWLGWGASVQDLPLPEWFSEVDSSLTALWKERWDTHLSRSIENQLDYAHLPFVHRRSIGRFAGPVNRRPEMQMDERRIRWCFTPEGQKKSFIEFRFPNIWINWISDRYAITLAFVPVSETCTELYLQNHRRFLNIPLLNPLLDYFMIAMNRKILKEDQRVVLTQTPQDVRAAQGEALLPSDQAIIHFRKWLSSGSV